MWLITLILAWGVVLLLVASHRRSKEEAQITAGECPHCQVALEGLRAPDTVQPRRSWEVLACLDCTLAVTVVQGVPASIGWCPECRQHALQLGSRRVTPDPDAPIVVEVEESCSLCKHSARIEVRRSAWEDQGPSPRGRVIPFPDDP